MANSITHIVKRDGHVVPFDQEKITVAIYKAGASLSIHDRPMSEKLSDEVCQILQQNLSHKNVPSVEEIQDIVEEVLIKNGQPKVAKAYILYREDRARQRRNKKENGKQSAEVIPYKKLWEILIWNLDHNCETIEKLNDHIRRGTVKDLIAEAEKAYHDDVARAAAQIIQNKGLVRLVIIAGPSCSGKTTTTIKLAEHLQKEGIKLIALNVDHYFFDIECQPQDEFGDHDFETPEALDLPLINQHLKELLEYKVVYLPRYDFKSGKRYLDQEPMQIHENEIILIDTLHGLYGNMTKDVPDANKFKLYIESLSQLRDETGGFSRWTDIRLLRRMIRDKSHRNYPPDKTIEHWHYVRRSELKHIIPYIPTVDYIVNGALCYDLPMLKKYLYPYFPQFVANYRDDPHHQDAYIRAKRILSLFEKIEELPDCGMIPPNSLAREFIGGSRYKY